MADVALKALEFGVPGFWLSDNAGRRGRVSAA
jgi:hypothetical protein